MTEPRMNEPVTRGELHESLETWAHVLIERMDRQSAEITAQLSAQLSAHLSAQNVEIARQIRASEERMRDYMRALLEPHDGVPERVTKLEEDLVPRVERLEARVFAPKRRSPTPRSRSRTRRR